MTFSSETRGSSIYSTALPTGAGSRKSLNSAFEPLLPPDEQAVVFLPVVLFAMKNFLQSGEERLHLARFEAVLGRQFRDVFLVTDPVRHEKEGAAGLEKHRQPAGGVAIEEIGADDGVERRREEGKPGGVGLDDGEVGLELP